MRVCLHSIVRRIRRAFEERPRWRVSPRPFLRLQAPRWSRWVPRLPRPQSLVSEPRPWARRRPQGPRGSRSMSFETTLPGLLGPQREERIPRYARGRPEGPLPVEDVIPSTVSLRQSLSSEPMQHIFIGSKDFSEFAALRGCPSCESGHRICSEIDSWTRDKVADSASLLHTTVWLCPEFPWSSSRNAD